MVLVYVFSEDLDKISNQYLMLNLNHEFDKTCKLNLAFAIERTCPHNEMHKSTHRIVDYL